MTRKNILETSVIYNTTQNKHIFFIADKFYLFSNFPSEFFINFQLLSQFPPSCNSSRFSIFLVFICTNSTSWRKNLNTVSPELGTHSSPSPSSQHNNNLPLDLVCKFQMDAYIFPLIGLLA